MTNRLVILQGRNGNPGPPGAPGARGPTVSLLLQLWKSTLTYFCYAYRDPLEQQQAILDQQAMLETRAGRVNKDLRVHGEYRENW